MKKLLRISLMKKLIMVLLMLVVTGCSAYTNDDVAEIIEITSKVDSEYKYRLVVQRATNLSYLNLIWYTNKSFTVGDKVVLTLKDGE